MEQSKPHIRFIINLLIDQIYLINSILNLGLKTLWPYYAKIIVLQTLFSPHRFSFICQTFMNKGLCE